jgi:Tfp pilus assembly pilus retraction ATPase PilT
MSYSLPGRARFRVNVFMQRDALGAVFRVIPFEIKAIEELGLPPIVADLARFHYSTISVDKVFLLCLIINSYCKDPTQKGIN